MNVSTPLLWMHRHLGCFVMKVVRHAELHQCNVCQPQDEAGDRRNIALNEEVTCWCARLPKDNSFYNLCCIVCVDVNECSTDAGGCDDMCTNTEGSYHCSCSSGLRLASDGHSCLGEPFTHLKSLIIVGISTVASIVFIVQYLTFFDACQYVDIFLGQIASMYVLYVAESITTDCRAFVNCMQTRVLYAVDKRPMGPKHPAISYYLFLLRIC